MIAEELSRLLVHSFRLSPPVSLSASDNVEGMPVGAQTRDEILEVAMRHLDQRGAIDFRVDEVVADADVSKSSLYHFFGGREGLIDAAENEWYLRSVVGEYRNSVQTAEDCVTPAEFQEFVRAQIVRSLTESSNVLVRRRRIAVIARMIGDGRDDTRIAAVQAAFIAGMAEIVRSAQRRGLVAPTLDCEAYAAYVHTATLGRTLTEPGFPDTERWLDFACDAAVAPLARGLTD